MPRKSEQPNMSLEVQIINDLIVQKQSIKSVKVA